ncbi:MAG: dihydroxy-acid dehydratase, partial [Alphaproteobacteria bacterium]|nr:dihydroxy-acid dehydratase [Alphaproteobacteria bacterium]
RMSGTSYGACILHVAPEAAVGGPIGLLKTGDRIALDVERRRLSVELSDAELAQRGRNRVPAPARYTRGYVAMFLQHIRQANEGCDFDFLDIAGATPEPEIH